MSKPPAPIRPARVEFRDGTPYAPAFGDSYFTPGQGLAESRAVFIDASELDARFAAMAPGELFAIGETGFGSGLNLLLAAQRFLEQAPQGAWLALQSVELHPLTRDDLARCLHQWPELEQLGQHLLAGYPPPVPGWHRIALADNIVLTLMVGDALDQWQRVEWPMDAWFLDGFAPSRNPAMWHRNLLATLGRLSRPGATLATFSAAGELRRGLSEAGFEVRREAGFGAKRHRLCARWPGLFKARRIRTGQAVIAGAGLAGATTARALAERGWQVSVLAPKGIADAASGNHAGVLYTTPSAHLTPQNRFYQAAFLRARAWLARLGFPATDHDGRLNNVVLAPPDERSRAKLERALSSGAWPSELLQQEGGGSFRLIGAGYLRPAAWCRLLLDHPLIQVLPVALRDFSASDRLSVSLSDGSTRATEALILCTGAQTRDLPGLAWLPLKLIRGQVSLCRATAATQVWTQAVCHAGYLTPALDDLHCVGASFDLKRADPVIDPADDAANLAQLREQLPGHWQALGGAAIAVVDRRAAVRCQSTDFLPLAGPLPDPRRQPHGLSDGVHLSIAHGSRGLTHTPLCAELIADRLSGRPSSVDPEITAALAPERFILRRRRRDPDWRPPDPT